jgi:signal transduction histidine kinase
MGDRDYRLDGAADGVLMADPERFTQVFRNLVRNAAAHTEPGDRITLTATPRNSRLEFSVADDGPEIPTDELERVFDRFHRAGPDRFGARAGTGLGLAIARVIVEATAGGSGPSLLPAGEP